MNADREKLIGRFQNLLAYKFICMIALYYSFLYGPATGLFRLYFYFFDPNVKLEPSESSGNFVIGAALVAFVLLLVLFRKLSKELKQVREKLIS